MQRTAILPGTFDPPSLGHLNLIQRASNICDKLYIAVGTNRNKCHPLFTVEERVALLKIITQSLPQTEVITFDGLVVDFAKKHHIDFLIRGLRAFADFEYERNMAFTNKQLSGIETVFLIADASLSHISASLIHEIAIYERRLHDFVPSEIEQIVYNKFQQAKRPISG